MAHTWSPVTVSDRTYTPMSDMTPKGAITETLTWAAIEGWTWDDLWNTGKIHWSDWYLQAAWTDAWDSLTTADRTYGSVTA